jgi:hypothetical protein
MDLNVAMSSFVPSLGYVSLKRFVSGVDYENIPEEAMGELIGSVRYLIDTGNERMFHSAFDMMTYMLFQSVSYLNDGNVDFDVFMEHMRVHREAIIDTAMSDSNEAEAEEEEAPTSNEVEFLNRCLSL